ncbi:hypothetical protein WN943_000717 [Citrus x changshan-huyou]
MAMAMAHVWSHGDLCIWESSNLLPLEISEPQVFNVNLSVMFLEESSALQIFGGIGVVVGVEESIVRKLLWRFGSFWGRGKVGYLTGAITPPSDTTPNYSTWEAENLIGLNPNLDEVCGRLLGMKPFPTLRELFAEVRREENRKCVMMNPSSQYAPSLETRGEALAANKQDNGHVSQSKDKDCSLGKMIDIAKRKDGLYYLSGVRDSSRVKSQNKMSMSSIMILCYGINA